MNIEPKIEIPFSCPECLGILHLGKKKGELAQHLICDVCHLSFTNQKGIYRFVSESNYSDSFGFQWNKFRKTQLDSYTGVPISKKRIDKVVNWSKDVHEAIILEAGSGAGRFTEHIVKTKAKVFSFDYSSAVEANYQNNRDSENLEVFQADIFKIPFKDNYFDYVICLGVIQHTPDPKEAFKSLAKKLKPGGSIFIDCYALKWHHYLQWKYLLRPLTKRINKLYLFRIIAFTAPLLIPLIKLSKSLFGRFGARIFPVVEYSELKLEDKINKDWSILDTFDMYSPEHDHPKSLTEVKSWFCEKRFTNIEVWHGDNGVVARATKR